MKRAFDLNVIYDTTLFNILRINLDGTELFPEGYGACDDSFEEARPEQA